MYRGQKNNPPQRRTTTERRIKEALQKLIFTAFLQKDSIKNRSKKFLFIIIILELYLLTTFIVNKNDTS